MRLAVLFAALFAVSASAQDDRRPPLFVLSDGDSRVYLLGSVHVLPDGALPLPDHVEAAYAEASVVAFEVDLDASKGAAAAMMAAAADEALLPDLLTAAQRDTVHARVGALGMPGTAFDGYEPWFAAANYGLVALQSAGLPVMAGGVDGHFYDRAGADGKERLGLETAEAQFAAFDGASDEAQVAYLMASVSADPVTDFADLVAMWEAGDDAGLAALGPRSLGHPEMIERALTARDRAWVPQIEALLARDGETALVVVGALHLVGDGGVVAMLREAGHTVERL